MTCTYQNRRGGTGAPLKQRFVKLLRELRKRNGIQQKDFVLKLGITASAASQIFSGALIPSPPRLDQLLEVLKPEVEEAQLLHDMAFWLRSGRREMPSEANRRLFFLRCRSGLSETDLERLSGIDAKRLNALEKQPGATPTDLELAALVAAMGKDVLAIAPSGRMEDRQRLDAADPGRTALLPRIGEKELRDYDGSEGIAAFGSRYARGFMECAGISPYAAAVAVVSASQLGFGGTGMLKMTLGESAPPDMEKLFLCGDRAGNLFILGGGFSTGAASCRKKAEWSIPLLEISYAPGREKP